MHWKPNPALYWPILRSRIEAGRGIDRGASYLPWKMVREIGSPGTCSEVLGVRSGRIHHLFSEPETTYFYLLERDSTVVDVREQWPILDLTRTFQLASSLGVPHTHWSTRNPEPLTIDFLVTRSRSNGSHEVARSVTSPAELADPDKRMTLAVAQAWCREKSVPWALVDTSKFSKTMLTTLRYIRQWFSTSPEEPQPEEVYDFSCVYLEAYRRNDLLADQLDVVRQRLHLSEKGAMRMFRYCAWCSAIPIDVRAPVALNRPVVLTAPR